MQFRSLPAVVFLCSAALLLVPGVSAKDKKKDDKKKDQFNQLTPQQQWQLWRQQHPDVATPRPAPPQPVNPTEQVQLTVYNQSGQPLTVIWVQPEVGLKNYGALPADGQPRSIGTFPGHVWLFKAGNVIVQRYTATNAPAQELTLGGNSGGNIAPPLPPPQPQPNNGGGNGGNRSDDRGAFLQVHNNARAAVGVAPLQWNSECAAVAQEWANQLAQRDTGLQHSGREGFGENIWEGSGRNYTPADAARDWLSEIRQYRGQAIDQTNYGAFGHYTQMVWSRTTAVGYGIARARSGNIYIVSNYAPPGNFLGETPY